MARLLSGIYLFLVACAAFAQNSTADAPAEHASPVAVMLFLVLFIGSSLGFVAYVWWRGRKNRDRGGE